MEEKKDRRWPCYVMLAIAGLFIFIFLSHDTMSKGESSSGQYIFVLDGVWGENVHYAIMKSSSMVPTIQPNDVVLWVTIDNTEELGVGDIIIYDHPTRPNRENIAHRIVEIGAGYRKGQFRTEGDNVGGEVWVLGNDIKGVVIGVIYDWGAFNG